MEQEAKDWMQLEEFIETLLRAGKRSKHEDFQMLFRIFGEERITKMAKDSLEKWKQNDSRKAKDEKK
jgi:Ca2+-binding EF-hand superfamily protein